MTEWRKSPTIAVVGLLLVVILQLAIPISRIGDNSETVRFGWQMFSTVGEPIEFTVHTSTGSFVIDLETVMARARGDIPLEELMPPHLCDTVEGANQVTWHDEVYKC